MNRKIFTIGYTAFQIDDFISRLKENKIGCLIDVRSNPKSAYYQDYDKQSITRTLNNNLIIYRNYANEFGARQAKKEYLHEEGYLDFEKYVRSVTFLSGIEKINHGLEKGYQYALMCAEKDPINCHRSIMITREMSRLGYQIFHITSSGNLETQKDLEDRLLDKFFPRRNQINLFEKDDDYDSLIKEAYRLQNKEIGYRMEDA